MKHIFCFVILVWLSVIANAQTFLYPECDTVLTEYNDGKFWAYLNKNDIVVGLSCNEDDDDYGKYYRLDTFIMNLGKEPVIFYPDSVYCTLLTRSDAFKGPEIL
ncbi:MAG: hypothetical protein NC343_00655 [Muribaculum sp.]|nr:hypothetical protein [Muribaculum sp.]